MSEDIKVNVVDKNFWADRVKTYDSLAKGPTKDMVGKLVSDLDRAHGDVIRLEEGVNRALRATNRRAVANTEALNKMADDLNTNMKHSDQHAE